MARSVYDRVQALFRVFERQLLINVIHVVLNQPQNHFLEVLRFPNGTFYLRQFVGPQPVQQRLDCSELDSSACGGKMTGRMRLKSWMIIERVWI